jgi:hypothetical protein
MIVLPLYFQACSQHCLAHSNLDPCLFISKDMIAVLYLDDLHFYFKSTDAIDPLITALHVESIWIGKEVSAGGFLGVKITPNASSKKSLLPRLVSLSMLLKLLVSADGLSLLLVHLLKPCLRLRIQKKHHLPAIYAPLFIQTQPPWHSLTSPLL